MGDRKFRSWRWHRADGSRRFVEGSCRPITSPTAYNVYGIPQRTSIGCSTYFFSPPLARGPRHGTRRPARLGRGRACRPNREIPRPSLCAPSLPALCPYAVQILQHARAHSRHRNSSFLSRNPRLWTSAESGSADRVASAHAGCTSARASVPNIRCIKLIDPPTAPAATAYANAATVLGKQNTGHRGLGKQNSDWRRPRMRPTGAECNQDQAAKLGAVPLWR